MMTFKVSFIKKINKKWWYKVKRGLAVVAQHTQCLANEEAEAQGF